MDLGQRARQELILNLGTPDNKTHFLTFEADSAWNYEPEWDEIYFRKNSPNYNNRKQVFLRCVFL